MDIKELNRIPIRSYLEKRGLHPKRDRCYYGMYFSPFREENVPSMKVDFGKNLWMDFGSGEGGTMIDLVMKLDSCSFTEAVKKLKNYASGHITSYPLIEVKNKPKKAPLIEIIKVQSLANSSLVKYLKERKINVDIAKTYCPEVYYNLNDRSYYAIGFENNTGGYELRNRYFKGSTSKDITTITTNSLTCSVFEGFFDFLSYLTLNNAPLCNEDAIVLNTVYNLSKAIGFISEHRLINSFFDNDSKGQELSVELKKQCRNAISQSHLYSGYKDLNAYLCGLPDEIG